MKRIIPVIALLATVALVGCGGDSPSAKPVPTVVPESWSITKLTASDSQVFVGTPVQIDISVTKDGAPAPDGTVVELLAAGPGTLFGFSRGFVTPGKGVIEVTPNATVVLEGGSATVFFLAADDPASTGDEPAGTYTIQARVKSAVRQISVNYLPLTAGETLVLTNIVPDRGPYSGGQTVTIYGINIEAPAEVTFILNDRPYPADVVSVEEGFDGWITVITPAFTGADSSIEQRADVRVKVAVGSDNEQIGRLDQAYTLLPDSVTQGPVIYGVNPPTGRSSGGEVVSVLGQGFGFPAANIVVEFISSSQGTSRRATVIAVAPDGSQIQVETPRFSTLPLTEDDPQTVQVTTPNGQGALDGAFLVLADNPTPDISSISPIAGPLDGGTLVTIFGSGFQAPMQVFFGDLTALDVNVFNDTTVADQDRITCVSPDYSQQGDVPPVAVPVRVVNMNSGLQDSYSSFTYGDNLYISGNSPQTANAGDLVIIYGSGFEDPLQVFFDDIQMEVVSVSGTEIVIRIPDEFVDDCDGAAGDFRVVLLESNLETEGGGLRIIGNTPLVTSVSPVIILEDDLGTPAADLRIFGQRFATEQVTGQDSVLVTIGTLVMPSNRVEVLSSGEIDVQNLLSVDEILPLGLDEEPCTVAGSPGVRNTSTPVDVTVANIPGNCADTLANAFVIEPSASNRECRVSPNISVVFDGTFVTPVSVGSCSAIAQPLIITNTVPGSTLTGDITISAGAPFFFNSAPNGVGGIRNASFINDATFDVFYCPLQPAPAPQTGSLTILSNDPDQGVINYTLTGTEGTP